MLDIRFSFSSWCYCYTILVSISLIVTAPPRKQPHVVFILVDDLGWNDVSFHGSDQIQTPNIDALAYQSVILQEYYTEVTCTPARAALLTGKYPMRMGMHGAPLLNSENRGIPLTERLLPSYFKEQGYSTHLVGKWHVGMSREEYLPTSRGYDTHYGMRGGYVDYYTYNNVEWPAGRQMFGLDLFDNATPQVCEERYIVDALTDRAVEIIRYHNSSRPMFLHVAHNAPHSANEGNSLQPPLHSPVKQSHIANSNRRLYAEIVMHLDHSVGRIFEALSERKMVDNTIIVFTSDNGASIVGFTRNWGVNLPLRAEKFTPWDGAARVPTFVYHSSLKPRVWRGLMHVTDWLPTLTAATGGKVPTDIDGVNQWDSIQEDVEPKRSTVLIALEDSSEYGVWAAYREGDYKIVIGNVSSCSNGYYGEKLMTNRRSPPDYYSVLRSCKVTKTFEDIGIFLDLQEVRSRRKEATIKQVDLVKDPTPCLPTQSRGCLYNIRRDPTESQNLWMRASKIATMLTRKVRELWEMQMRRGPLKLDIEADPKYFDYIWTPWISSGRQNILRENLSVLPLYAKETENRTTFR